MTYDKAQAHWFFYFMLMIVSIAMLSACSEEEAAKPAEEKRVSVRAVKAETGEIQSWVFAEGTARSAAREYLVFQNVGKITYIKPDLREGSLVEKGTVLARQDQRRLNADLKEARTQADLAQKTFSRFATLLKQRSASQQEYDEAKAQADQAKATLDKMQVAAEETELIAPIDGMIAYLNIEEGYYFQPSIVRTDSEEAALNTVPIIMIDPNTFEIAVDIPVYDRDRVQVGQTVLIQTHHSEAQIQPSSAQDSINDQNARLKNRTGQTPPTGLNNPGYIRGEVYSVNPAVSPSGRSIQVEIRTKNENMSLKDGMYVTVWIATERKDNVVTAPLESFIFRDNQPYVFVINDADNTVNLREVILGLQGFDSREVINGVKANEWIVTEGRYQLSNGTKVKILGDTLPEQPQRDEADSGNE